MASSRSGRALALALAREAASGFEAAVRRPSGMAVGRALAPATAGGHVPYRHRFSTSSSVSGAVPVSDFRSTEMDLTKFAYQLNQQQAVQAIRHAVLDSREERMFIESAQLKENQVAAQDKTSRAEALMLAAESIQKKAAADMAAAAAERAQAAWERCLTQSLIQNLTADSKRAEQKTKAEEEKKKKEEEKKAEEEKAYGRLKKFWKWLKTLNLRTYITAISLLLAVLIEHKKVQLSIEFLVNLGDVCKEHFLKDMLELVAEAQRRTDGIEAIPDQDVNLVFAFEGMTVKFGQVKMTQKEFQQVCCNPTVSKDVLVADDDI